MTSKMKLVNSLKNPSIWELIKSILLYKNNNKKKKKKKKKEKKKEEKEKQNKTWTTETVNIA